VNQRRRVLFGVMAAAGSAAAGWWYFESSRRELRLNEVFDREAIRAVGTAYLDLHPDERDPGILKKQVFDARHFDSEPALLHFLAERISRDFDNIAVVTIDDWMLSRTEARLAALATFTDSVSL
jgi:hypothetical protein